MIRFLGMLLAFCLPSLAACAEGPNRFDRFFDSVKPVLAGRCVSCHGPDKQKGGLRLDSREALLKGGDKGPVVVPGKPEQSGLILAIEHAAGQQAMPPKEKLKEGEIASLATWVREGAVWPNPAQMLFEDETATIHFLAGTKSGSARLESSDRSSGKSAMAIRGQCAQAQWPGWAFAIREQPGPNEYRYLRFSWKKIGGGALMVEVANAGKWRTQGQTHGAWVAGPNSTGWPAHAVSQTAPSAWTTVTRDLWADGGSWKNFTLTGLGITAIDGGEALIDGIVLGRTLEDLDAYRPGRAHAPPKAVIERRGDAWSDPANPVVEAFKNERLDLWSLKKPIRPPVPLVKNQKWGKGPLDQFILAKLEAAGLNPSPEADRRTLIRRLSFDLLGLPPTLKEIEAFVNDSSPAAYETLVDRLLASPHYAERWARHWLDVVRYADTNGYERDEFRPEMWRYRDYVVRAFHADKPYDRFVREQLAGDEFVPGVPGNADEADALIATGFLRLGQYDSTGDIFEEGARNRAELLADLTNTTGSAFLGLTLSCCQCHDHKYDPLLQADHYRLRAFFAAVKPLDDRAIDLPPRWEEINKFNAVIQGRIAQKKAAQKKLLDAVKKKPNEKLEVTKKALSEEALKAYEKLASEIDTEKAGLKAHTQAAVMTDAKGAAKPSYLLFQGDYTQPRAEVQPGILSVFDPNPTAIGKVPAPTTGRRTALANWIVAKENPLTARVLVNRLWAHHFGRGIVATPNDFGFSGAKPTHPELLDWLALELIERGWSIKQMHRTMLLSATYRQASRETAEGKSKDLDNRWFWRQNPKRLDAETIRDSLLFVSGKLLPDAGGPPRWPEMPDDLLRGQPSILEALEGHDGGRRQGWYTTPAEGVAVRSLYLIQKRALPVPFLQSFDFPDTTTSCGCRNVSTVAPQALTLLNGPEAARLTRAFAARVWRGAKEERLNEAFQLALGRCPEKEERVLAEDLLLRHERQYRQAGHADGDLRALTDLCRSLLNLNEFVYID